MGKFHMVKTEQIPFAVAALPSLLVAATPASAGLNPAPTKMSAKVPMNSRGRGFVILVMVWSSLLDGYETNADMRPRTGRRDHALIGSRHSCAEYKRPKFAADFCDRPPSDRNLTR
jgi:hypothetical protein